MLRFHHAVEGLSEQQKRCLFLRMEGLRYPEIGAALGATFAAGEPIGTTGCSWSSASPHMIVTVSLWPPAEWDRIKAGGGIPGTKITPVSGLGDDAFYATIPQYVVLYVKKGQTVYLFKVYGVKDQAKQMSVEKTLAGNAVKRL